MIELTLPDMTCGHCAGMVSRTCALVDPNAKVVVDVPARRVAITSLEDREDFVQALAEAGYPPA